MQPARPDGDARRRWWAAAAAPELEPISVRRAYAEVLLVFAAFFATGVVGAALLLAGRYKNLLEQASWALYATQVVDVVAQIGLAVAVVVLLGARRGVTPSVLGVRAPRRPDGRLAVSQTVRIVAWALVALIVGGVINALLQSGHLPTGTPSAPELVFGLFDSVQAGIVEELVVLAFVVVTLRQARRPWWEITLVALVLRGSYHIYYGPGVLGIVVWAALYYWTYLRFRQLVPLMVCHALWDAVGFLSQRWPAVAVVAVLAVIAVWIAAPILWLVERSERSAAQHYGGLGYGAWSYGAWSANGGPASGPVTTAPTGPPRPAGRSGPAGASVPAGPPPGWHPDPGGENRWRWWDGRAWTEHVSAGP